MKNLFYLTVILLLMTVPPAFAQSSDDPTCKFIASHTPAADVSYHAGVDVHGKPVVPADLNAAPAMLPETIVVPLTIDLAQRLENQGIKGLTLDGNAGYLEIDPKSGMVRWNDQDITPAMTALCGQKSAPSDGQEGVNVIKSDQKPIQTAP